MTTGWMVYILFESLRMRRTIITTLLETAAYTAIAALMARFVFYLCYADPVNFVRMITEDNWGEYATAVAYGICSLLLFWLSFQPARRLQRIVLLLIGLGAFFVAGEEISWGQRIIGFSTPEILSEVNYQGELNLHNFDVFDSVGLRSAAHLTVGWLFLSLVVAVGFRQYRDRIQRAGVLLVPVQLFPIFLLGPYFDHSWPVPKSDEIGEFFLGIAMAAWALDRFLRHRWVRYSNGLPAVGIMSGMFVLVMISSVTLTHMFPNYGAWKWRLNFAAVLDYPSFKMFDQSQRLYEYIYANPQYITEDTRIQHARMLLEIGEREKAIETLIQAAEFLEAVDPPMTQQARRWMRLGITHMLLGQSNQALNEFDKSNEIYQRQFVSHPDPQRDALILWWNAKTLLARGDVSAAVKMAKDARENATSRKLRRELGQWIECTRAQNYYLPWYCSLWLEFATRSF